MPDTPVVIGSHPGSPWLGDCLKTIPKGRKITVHTAGGYEIAALRTAITHHDRFVFLQDSCEVLDTAFWDIIDASPPTWLFGGPPMYLGVYHRNDLEQAIADAPEVMDKSLSIAWEGALPQRLDYGCLWPEVSDVTGRHEDRHGRPNLVLENSLLRKWKGTWG